MTTEPSASAKRVFRVVDNGSSHNQARSVERMDSAWPNAALVHLPVHASWLNQVEIYFSILQRRAITGGDFKDLSQLLGACSLSRTATTPPRNRLTGRTPVPISTTTCTG